MKRVTMTLCCMATNSTAEVLHFRPLEILRMVCQVFANTEILIHRDLKNCPTDFLKECPNAAIDPREYMLMTIAIFKHGENVILEVSGKNEDLALALIKTTWEHLYLEKQKLFELLFYTSQVIDDPESTAILAKIERQLAQPPETQQVVAKLNHSLHSLTAHIFPEMAKYFDCQIFLSYQMPSGLILRRYINPNERGVVYDLLNESPEKGTPITIGAEGERQEEAIKAFRGIIENLSEIEYWIKKRHLSIVNPTLLREVLDIAYTGVEIEEATRDKGIYIHKLLRQDAVFLSQGARSKQQAIGELMAVHSSNIHIPISRIDKSVWERERIGGTLLPKGLAIPHALLDGIEGIWLSMGVYRNGIDWYTDDEHYTTGDKFAYVIFLFLFGSDARNRYLQYLAQVAQLFGGLSGLISELRNIQSASQAINVLRHAEISLAEKKILPPYSEASES